MSRLVPTKKAELERREAIIERGLADAWNALREIHDLGLYLETHATFDEYCRERLNIARRTAYQLIDAARVIENVRNCAHQLPACESQVRPLARLEPAQQREAWSHAVETAPNGQPTAAHVKATIDEMFPRHEPLDGQASSLDRDEPETIVLDQIETEPEPEEATEPSPDPPTRSAAQKWQKVLNDYCMLIRSFEKAGGVEWLTREWDRHDVESFIELFEEASRAFQQLKERTLESLS